MDDHKPFDPDRIDETGEGPVELDEPVEQMSMKDSFGTAVGAAMLGFENALRKGPPPETLAAEHVPERGEISGGDGELLIQFPEPMERRPTDE